MGGGMGGPGLWEYTQKKNELITINNYYVNWREG